MLQVWYRSKEVEEMDVRDCESDERKEINKTAQEVLSISIVKS